MPAVVTPEPAPALDDLARRALARLAPLTFDRAESAAERDGVLRMRYECVVAEGWARPDDHPDGRERDEYDDEAVFVVSHDGDTLVGSLRLVAPTPARPLPTERDFGVRLRAAGRVLEVGRILVAPEARRGRSHLVLGGLCACAWLEAHARGFDRAVSTATPELIDFYQSLGLRISVLGPAQLHWGAMRAPILIEGDEGSFGFLTG
ncbi:MAG: N-acyl amino acid synthase FeeM domain-containing protein [Acidimicrobiales bacterium]